MRCVGVSGTWAFSQKTCSEPGSHNLLVIPAHPNTHCKFAYVRSLCAHPLCTSTRCKHPRITPCPYSQKPAVKDLFLIKPHILWEGADCVLKAQVFRRKHLPSQKPAAAMPLLDFMPYWNEPICP